MSDARIKTVTGDYEHGLAEIERLRPITYRFNGNDTESKPATGEAPPYFSSPHYSAAMRRQEFVGLVAQDCREIMPELVSLQSGFISGDQVDLCSVDPTPLIYALINAAKELSARVKVLENQLGLRTF